MSFYLGPAQPRRHLDTWEDIVAAAGEGVLEESRWVELKQALPVPRQGKSKKDANAELAADLASLSVDGGVFIVGIADDHGRAGEVTGTTLEGARTKISQVAANTISPALVATTTLVDKPDQAGVGLVVVEVPASADAPHMVDGSYWGRSEEGKTRLSDAQVRRLLDQRQAAKAGFADRLLAMASTDPPGLAEQARLYLLLEPATDPVVAIGDALRGSSVRQVAMDALSFEPDVGPSLLSLSYAVPHAEGLAAASLPVERYEGADYHMFVLLADSGAVHLSAPAVHPSGEDDTTGVPGWVVVDHLLETVHSALLLAAHLAHVHTGQQGSWNVGLHATGLQGVKSTHAVRPWLERYASFQTARYTRTLATTPAAMRDSTPALVQQLTAGLLRGLGVEDRYLPYDDVLQLRDRRPS